MFPSGGELVEAIHKVLTSHPQGLSTEDLDDAVADFLKLDQQTLSEKLSDGKRSKYKYRMAWARVSAKKSLGMTKQNKKWCLPK
jgi:restriction endonuclease Mrr